MKSLREYGTFNEKGRVDMAALSQLARSLEPLLPSPQDGMLYTASSL